MMQKYGKLVLILCGSIALSACLPKKDVEFVFDAENMMFTEDEGRLFVTGHDDIVEVEKTYNWFGFHTGYKATKIEYLIPEEGENNKFRCFFTGIAEQNDWLFSVCKSVDITDIDPDNPHTILYDLDVDNRIYATKLEDNPEDMRLIRLDPERFDEFDNLFIPNGIAFAPNGDLLVADERFFIDDLLGQESPGAVARVSFGYGGGAPYIADYEIGVIGEQHGIHSVNGLRMEGDTLFLSSENKVYRLDMDDDGNFPVAIPGRNGATVDNAKVVWKGPNSITMIVDDIYPICGGVAITDFVHGRLVYAGPRDSAAPDPDLRPSYVEDYITLPFNYNFPSSVMPGDGGMFKTNELLVTEKGVFFNNDENIGNHVVVSKLNYDMKTCKKL